MNERKLGIKNIIRNRKRERESDRDREKQPVVLVNQRERWLTMKDHSQINIKEKKRMEKGYFFSLNNKEILKEIERKRNVLNPFSPPHHINF